MGYTIMVEETVKLRASEITSIICDNDGREAELREDRTE